MIETRIWISWSFHRRSTELARAFSARYVHMDNGQRGRLGRYAHCVPRTLALLLREKPSLLFVQNPSLLLTTIAVLLRPLFRYTLVNDLHTPYIRLTGIRKRIFWRLQEFCARHADLTIVTNEGVKESLPAGGAVAILPDKIPSIGRSADREPDGSTRVLFVCSFAEDEPYEEVRRAAALIDESIAIFVTGNHRSAGWSTEEMPPNLHLTGYLPVEEYEELLHSADIVMTLTAQENCLVCGAYEGVAAGKPLILSNRRALRDYFSAGAVYVDHTPESIAGGIRSVVGEREWLVGEIAELKRRLDRDWQKRFDEINALLPPATPAST
jgi:glycosyltransferase involved in cell wall biosynthesis